MNIMLNHKGFTLIELMVVVVIIGILAAIALPNFLSMQDRAKEAEVKSNCHAIQLAVEGHKVLNAGNKPALANIIIEARMKNPYISANTGVAAVTAENLPAIPAFNSNSGIVKGQVGYTQDMGGTSGNPYIITGTGKNIIYVIVLSEGG